ncbi:hypothetical protein R1flu_019549 [Riccia fluitans]|uniref:Uncharacterized protein n=1 Tax=Riccia fluitans TaxID=41844 RepID=A0ABD1ZIZ5_9MARC
MTLVAYGDFHHFTYQEEAVSVILGTLRLVEFVFEDRRYRAKSCSVDGVGWIIECEERGKQKRDRARSENHSFWIALSLVESLQMYVLKTSDD